MDPQAPLTLSPPPVGQGLPFSEEDLFEFLLALRSEQYRVGPAQIVAARLLLNRLERVRG
jgi:hypothetical protein